MAGQCDLSFQQKNLFQQGFQSYTPAELKQVEWGLRFTPAACSLIALYGLIVLNPYILLGVAFLGMWAFFFPKGHPMDLIYNHLVRKMFGAVELPPNPLQRRLACFSAGIMNTIAAIFIISGMPVAAYITGGMLLTLQAIVIFTHFCTLSWMYEGALRALGKWAKPLDEVTAAKLLAEGAMLVDVRGPDEFSAGHLNAAINIPLEQVADKSADLKGCPVLLYCRSGSRTQIALKILQQAGLDNIYDIGGYARAERILESAKTESVEPVVA